jgi:superfamily II DNA or RNA helicase
MAVLSEIDLTRNFNPMVLIRAREYERAKKVIKAHIEVGGWIYGLVKGSDIAPYSQVINYRPGAGGYEIQGNCTCPTGANCKHVGAVLFHLISQSAFEKVREAPDLVLSPTHPQLEKWLASVQDAAEDHTRMPEGARQELLFVVKVEKFKDRVTPLLQPMTAQFTREKTWSQVQNFRLASLRAQTAPRYLRRSDVELLKRLEAHLKSYGENASFDLSSIEAAPLLQQVLETGRCFWSSVQGKSIHLGPAVKVEPLWVEDDLGFQRFKFKGIKGKILPLTPPWYADPVHGTCGLLDTGLGPRVAQALCAAPPIAPENSARVRQVLSSVLGRDSHLLPSLKNAPEQINVEPTPRLILGWTCLGHAHSHSAAQKSVSAPFATLSFTYQGHDVVADSSEIRFVDEQGAFLVVRDLEQETSAGKRLEDANWIRLDRQTKWVSVADHPATHILLPEFVGLEGDREQSLLAFIAGEGRRMIEEGWRILWEDGSPVKVHEARLEAEVQGGGADTLRLSLHASATGDRIDLQPIVKSLNRAGFFDKPISDSNYYVRAPSGQILSLSGSKLREIFFAIYDIFGDSGSKDLLLPKVRSLELQTLTDAFDSIALPDRIVDAIHHLNSEGTEADKEIAGFDSILRSYQREGVCWLRFLYDFGFGGILADDMGLGKTVQTLAHIQSLKTEGKLTKPVLIVAPTSTLPNWHAEMKRFVPDLSVLLLHGISRREGFDAIPNNDVVLTSYPLLVRDRDILLPREYSVVVLDEAQNIKNSSTHAARAAYEIKADSKVALTGTPVENHLEELWSIFRFALPGLLGSQLDFRREFRIPIESGAGRGPREKLERRTRPFMIRRTKEQVAPELPAKTEIVDYIPLEASQREFYDAVSLAADRQIRESILQKGWDETRFEALQALLRLRQICCDPRLLKQDKYESSKLERLVSMLRELKDAGRRTLVFSQFTSMLDLIEARLKLEEIETVRLCGSTKDRSLPVKKFQTGEIPVFLISLKAGGVGLNLTAADTVIHYDPWWNPAVERQATDRAHRIGQDKPVFVYKLVAADTVEERILLMQEKKSEISQILFGDEVSSDPGFSPQDLQWMLGNSLAAAI